MKTHIPLSLILVSFLLASCSTYTIKKNPDMDRVSEKITKEKKDLWIHVEEALSKPVPKKEPELHLYILKSLGNLPYPQARSILKKYFTNDSAKKRDISLASYWKHRNYYDETTIKEEVYSAIEKNYYTHGLLSNKEISILIEIDNYPAFFLLCQYISTIQDLNQKNEMIQRIHSLDKTKWSNDRKDLIKKCLLELLNQEEIPENHQKLREELWKTLLSIEPSIQNNILISIIRDKAYPMVMRKEAIIQLNQKSDEPELVYSELKKILKEKPDIKENNLSGYPKEIEEKIIALSSSISDKIPKVKHKPHRIKKIHRPQIYPYPRLQKRSSSVKYRNHLHSIFMNSNIPNSVFRKMENSHEIKKRDKANILYTTFILLYPESNYYSINKKYENIFSHPYFFTTFITVLKKRYPRKDLQASYLAQLWNISANDAEKILSLYQKQYRKLRYAGL